MLRIAGQTAGPIRLNFLWTLMGSLKKLEILFSIFFKSYFFPRATPGSSANN